MPWSPVLSSRDVGEEHGPEAEDDVEERKMRKPEEVRV